MKKVIITGISGQDGYLLSKYLTSKNYIVLGLSTKKNKKKNIIKTDYSKNSLKKIIYNFNPDEIYHLAGITNPSESWKNVEKNFIANFHITMNLLEILKIKKKIKLFNASSCEIFDESSKPLNENSKIFPKNPYGIAKSASYFLTNAYRSKYKLFIVNGILFNHVSDKSNKKYLLQYLLESTKKIKQNKITKISIKDSRPIRDFGYAKDFVEYFHKLMNLKKPGNYIIASGKSYSVKQITGIFEAKFNFLKNKFKFENKLDFKDLYKSRYANNSKLIKSLKLKSLKKLPQIIDILIKEI